MASETIIAVQRNHQGDIINFQTSEGRIISYRKAIQEVEAGVITDVQITHHTDEIPLLTPVTSRFEDFPTI